MWLSFFFAGFAIRFAYGGVNFFTRSCLPTIPSLLKKKAPGLVPAKNGHNHTAKNKNAPTSTFLFLPMVSFYITRTNIFHIATGMFFLAWMFFFVAIQKILVFFSDCSKNKKHKAHILADLLHTFGLVSVKFSFKKKEKTPHFRTCAEKVVLWWF